MSDHQRRYQRLQRVKTFGLHDVLLRFSQRYKLYYFAGLSAISINCGANINREIVCLQREFNHLAPKFVASAIIFHPQFGEIRNKKG